EAAADLDMTYEELTAALNTLFVSGATQNTEDLIDLSWDFRKVNIIDSQGMDKPLRLTPTEASALLLALESLESMPVLLIPKPYSPPPLRFAGLWIPRLKVFMILWQQHHPKNQRSRHR